MGKYKGTSFGSVGGDGGGPGLTKAACEEGRAVFAHRVWRGRTMGIYLNPENDGFWESIRSEIYVDTPAPDTPLLPLFLPQSKTAAYSEI